MTESSEHPKARAQEYKEQQGTQAEPPPRTPKTPEQWRDLVSQRIDEAMRAGAFENLRGRGQPLDPQPDPFTPADMQMANSLLKHNELVPAWIADRRALLAAIERFQTRVKTASTAHRAALAAAASPQQALLSERWEVQLNHWRQEAIALNRRIEAQNFRQPAFLEILKVRLEELV